jgi:hypothetical protein
MLTIKDQAQLNSLSYHDDPHNISEEAFIEGVEFAQEWISITKELPECKHIDETDDMFSDYVLVKILGYEHPFVAFYCKIGENEGFDLVHLSVDETTDKKAITHWRPIERI